MKSDGRQGDKSTSKSAIFFILTVISIGLLGISGCSKDVPNGNQLNLSDNEMISSNLSASQELKQFSSVTELRKFLESQQNNAGSGSMNYDMARLTSSKGIAVNEGAVAPAASNSGAGGSSDYSQTNVQVKGVDEADFVKNDDKYIYIIADNKLVIVDALKGNAADSKIISETQIDNGSDNYYGRPNVRDMLLSGDKVVLFVDKYERSFFLSKYDIQPQETSRPTTVVMIYDVSDRTSPELKDEFTLSGSYYSSRMIGDKVYVISQEGLYNWVYYDGPMVKSAKRTIMPQIYYFDNPEQNYNMNTITSFDIGSDSIVDTKSFMLGYGDTVMVSEDNIYIAYQKQNFWCWRWSCQGQENDLRERFVTVVVPLLKGELKMQVRSILNEDLSQEEEWTKISRVFTEFYSKLSDDQDLQKQYEDMFGDIESALNEYDAKKAIENGKTIIHRIAIDDGKIEYASKGEVDGRLLNQFSMDEKDGNLRVATTVSMWLRQGSIQYNNVYVLDKDMQQIGSLEDLAQNESIYSTRFVGDKLFMVTFRQIDPFFVIDLSDPKDPKVEGFLKIPGYSSYLHPISETIILGVGKETGENQYGGITTKGVKVSLFDISDFNNPVELDKYEIGMEGTDSPVLYNHKAFLYSPTKDIVVIPVSEVTEKKQTGQYDYTTSMWNGAYVFDLSGNELSLKGKVKHSSSENRYYYWFNDASVRRSLYMDDFLYTISTKYIKVNDLANNLEEINSITLPYADYYKDYPTPIMI